VGLACAAKPAHPPNLEKGASTAVDRHPSTSTPPLSPPPQHLLQSDTFNHNTHA
jgi:hypothetical protein